MKTRDNGDRSQSEMSSTQNSEAYKNDAILYALDVIPFHQDSPLYEKIHDEALSKVNNLCDETE